MPHYQLLLQMRWWLGKALRGFSAPLQITTTRNLDCVGERSIGQF